MQLAKVSTTINIDCTLNGCYNIHIASLKDSTQLVCTKCGHYNIMIIMIVLTIVIMYALES